MANRRKALTVLIIFALLAIAGRWLTLSSSDNFLWQLLYHGAVAATIGGLADWFAVEAIFRRPLGLRWRTEILRKNRARLTDALVDFCGAFILGRDNLLSTLKDINTAEMLLDYLNLTKSREKLTAAVNKAAVKAVASLDTGRTAEKIAAVINTKAKEFPFDDAVRESFKNIADTEIPAVAAQYAAVVIRQTYRSCVIQTLIQNAADGLYQTYISKNPLRGMALKMAGFTSEKIAARLDAFASEKINNLGVIGTAENKKLADHLAAKLIETADTITAHIENKLNEFAAPSVIAPLIAEKLDAEIKNSLPEIKAACRSLIEEKIVALAGDEELKAKIDAEIKFFLASQLDAHRDFLTDLIRNRFDSLSDEELVTMSEDYVADDLQMIRINGSIVGGIAGAALFILTVIVGKI